jgi:hypothetical protein
MSDTEGSEDFDTSGAWVYAWQLPWIVKDDYVVLKVGCNVKQKEVLRRFQTQRNAWKSVSGIKPRLPFGAAEMLDSPVTFVDATIAPQMEQGLHADLCFLLHRSVVANDRDPEVSETFRTFSSSSCCFCIDLQLVRSLIGLPFPSDRMTALCMSNWKSYKSAIAVEEYVITHKSVAHSLRQLFLKEKSSLSLRSITNLLNVPWKLSLQVNLRYRLNANLPEHTEVVTVREPVTALTDKQVKDVPPSPKK